MEFKKNFKNINVNILTYNLYWWNLYGIRKGNGNSAGNLIIRSSNIKPFDIMGFQECDDINRVLHDSNLAGKYTTINGGYAVGLMYNNNWIELNKQSIPVAEDSRAQYFGKRIISFVRLQHRITKHTLFFINHHGPLPVNSGGLCGSESVAYNILKVIGENSHSSDSIVVVGDFNSDVNSNTIRVLKSYLYHIYNSNSYGGVDNIFASSNNIIATENLGNGGSDHNAIRAEVLI